MRIAWSSPIRLMPWAPLLAATALIAALAGCGGATGLPSNAPATIAPSASPKATPLPSEVGSVGPFSPARCPESEAVFCTPAATVAEAIVAGDVPAIVGLSRPDEFRCEDLDVSIFRGCESAVVLEGHPIGTAGGSIEVFPESDYREQLEATKA